MIVPITQQTQLRQQALAQPVTPPSPIFALMAAAQMHTESRLIKKPLDPKADTTTPAPKATDAATNL